MKLYRAFATVGGLTMVSRVLGFARDILIAATLGSGAVADAFFVAFRFPNLFRRLFGEGAFNSAFVPLFAGRLEGEGREAARKFAEEALAGLVFILLLLTAIAEIAMPFLMLGLAPGFCATPEKFDLAVLLTRITMPYLLCMSVVALLSGVLNSVGKFVESSAVSIVLNLTMMAATIIAIMMGLSNEPLAGVVQAWGVFAAGFLQLALLLYGVRRNGLALKLRWPRMTDGVRRLITLGIPGIIAGGVTQINIVIGTVIASMQNGAVSHLYYADRIYELPLAIVGIAIGVVLLPDVSRQLRAGNHAGVMDSQNRSFEFAMLLTVPAAVALAVAPTAIVQGLFQRGAFTAADTPPTAYALAIFALGLPSFVMIKVFSPAYFAREDTATPMRYAVLSLTANTLGSIALVLPVPLAGPHAASRHRRGDHAGRMAQCRPPVRDAGQAWRSSSPDARLDACAQAHRDRQPGHGCRRLDHGHRAAGLVCRPERASRASAAWPCWWARGWPSTARQSWSPAPSKCVSCAPCCGADRLPSTVNGRDLACGRRSAP